MRHRRTVIVVAGLLWLASAAPLAAQGALEKKGGEVLVDSGKDLVMKALERMRAWWKELPARPPEKEIARKRVTLLEDPLLKDREIHVAKDPALKPDEERQIDKLKDHAKECTSDALLKDPVQNSMEFAFAAAVGAYRRGGSQQDVVRAAVGQFEETFKKEVTWQEPGDKVLSILQCVLNVNVADPLARAFQSCARRESLFQPRDPDCLLRELSK